MTVTFNMMEAKTQLSKLVEMAVHGEDVVIANRGRPMVRLQRVEKRQRPLGFLPGPDLPDAFFDPLPEDELQAWGM